MNSQIAAPFCANKQSGPTSVHDIEIILPEGAAASGAQMFRDLFDAANDLIPAQHYRVTLRSLLSPLPEDPQLWQRRTVIFLGDIQSRWQVSPAQRSRLRQLLRLAARVVLVGGAVFLPRVVGQLKTSPLAIHPNFAAAAVEEQLVASDPGQHVASAGIVNSASSPFAALRLLLRLIRDDHGQQIANALGQYLGLSDSSKHEVSKVSLHLRQRACGDTLIATTLQLMQDNLEDPKQIRELAAQVGVSTRKLERRFQDKTDTTPLAAYRMLRVERAHQLLVHTDLPLAEIVVATGFGSRTNLRHWFKKGYGTSPQTLRQQSFAGKTPTALPAYN